MPSKLRLIVRFDGGSFRTGGQAKDYIRKFAVKYGMKEPTTWKEYVQTVEDLPFASRAKEILVLREPRRVDAGRSRYMNICGKYGLRGARGRTDANVFLRPAPGVASAPRFTVPDFSHLPEDANRALINGITYRRNINSGRWRTA